jgi:hypothetical protein
MIRCPKCLQPEHSRETCEKRRYISTLPIDVANETIQHSPQQISCSPSQNHILDLDDLILNNSYLKKVSSNKKKDNSSLCSLVSLSTSQSDNIKLGIAMESIFRDIIARYKPELENIKPKNKKGQKERDILYKCDETKEIYYAEAKGNINLDTEKSASTARKINRIDEELRQQFPGYIIHKCLLALRYVNKKDIPQNLLNKYAAIDGFVFGVNDFLSLVGIPKEFISFTLETYIVFVNKVAKKIINSK